LKATAKPTPSKSSTVPSKGSESVERLTLWVSIALTAWVLVLHLMYAGHAGPLWRDEASSVNFASVPTVGEMWNNFRFDNFPPLFAFVLRGCWMTGMTNDIAWRVLGLSVSVLVLSAVWMAVWLMAQRPPLLALALFALNPLAIKTDGAIRPYGLGFAFLILAIALIFAYARKPGRAFFILATIASALAVQILYQAAFFLAATILGACAYAWMEKHRRTAMNTVFIGMIAACSLAIDLPHLLHDWGKTQWVGQSSFEISKTAVDWPMLGSAFWRAISNMGTAGAWLWCVIAVIVFVTLATKRGSRPYVISLLVATIVYLCFLRFSGLHAQSWYFLVLIASGALLLDAMTENILQRTLKQAVLIAVLLLAIVSAPAAWDTVRTRATSIDLVAQVLKRNAGPKDVVLTMPWYYGVTLGRYYDRQKFTTVPPLNDVSIHRYDLVQRAMESSDPIAGLMRDMEQALRNGNTVWTIGEIILPENNEPVPFLPPYTPGNGYSDSDYLTSWSMQIAVFLAGHAKNFDVVKVPDAGPVTPLENPKVVAVSGWHD
jgi:hypothetical protein